MNRSAVTVEFPLPLVSNRRDADFRIVVRDVGALQMLIGACMIPPFLLSLALGERYTALSFLAASAVTVAFGAIARYIYRGAEEPERHHAMIIAGAGWFVTALFGALPFLFAAYLTPLDVAQGFVPAGESYMPSLLHFRNPLHAVFESMSAYTTTGLTMSVHEPSIGRGLLYYRSQSQWIGGVGVIVLALAIMPRPRSVAGLELYQSETREMKLRPTILGTARVIWRIYSAITFLVVVYLFLATLVILPGYGVGASLFDAVNHAMTGLATGGFSTLDDSIAGYGSYAMEMIHLLPMTLGAISFPLYYAFLRQRNLRVFSRDPQFRSMILLFVVLIPILAFLLIGTPAVANPVRESIFQIVTSVSGTGWQTSSIGDWSNSAVLLLAWGTMVVSGAAGSTVGGIKLIRAYVLLRAVRWRITKVFLPNEAVVPFRVGERSLPAPAMQREVADASIFSFLYLGILAVAILVVAHQVGPEFTLADVIFECVSAQSTIGLSSGITDPGMPATVELSFIFQMWVGRLEIFPVIILLGAGFRWILRR